MTTRFWYFIDNSGTRIGPVAEIDLISQLKDGSLRMSQLAWTDGMEEWSRISEVPGLLSHVEGTVHSRLEDARGLGAEADVQTAPPEKALTPGGLSLDSILGRLRNRDSGIGMGFALAGLALGTIAFISSFIPCLGLFAVFPAFLGIILGGTGAFFCLSTQAKAALPIAAVVVNALSIAVVAVQYATLDSMSGGPRRHTASEADRRSPGGSGVALRKEVVSVNNGSDSVFGILKVHWELKQMPGDRTARQTVKKEPYFADEKLNVSKILWHSENLKTALITAYLSGLGENFFFLTKSGTEFTKLSPGRIWAEVEAIPNGEGTLILRDPEGFFPMAFFSISDRRLVWVDESETDAHDLGRDSAFAVGPDTYYVFHPDGPSEYNLDTGKIARGLNYPEDTRGAPFPTLGVIDNNIVLLFKTRSEYEFYTFDLARGSFERSCLNETVPDGFAWIETASIGSISSRNTPGAGFLSNDNRLFVVEKKRITEELQAYDLFTVVSYTMNCQKRREEFSTKEPLEIVEKIRQESPPWQQTGKYGLGRFMQN